MTKSQARKWIVLAGFILIGAQLLFLIVAKHLGFPLHDSQGFELSQIIIPIFLGYAVAATKYVLGLEYTASRPDPSLLRMIVIAPIIIYASVVIATFFVFGYSNRSGAPMGEGMSVGELRDWVFYIISLWTALIGLLTSYLFKSSD